MAFLKVLRSAFANKFKKMGMTSFHYTVPFSVMFQSFRDVLDRNNTALAIITDMGEKLGGDYIFDINYIRKAYSGLSATVQGSMQSFDVLTGSKHAGLRDVFNRIDEQIKRMIFDATPSSRELILPYEYITWDKYQEVGGKNSNLAEMRNSLKLNIPDGFAITTHAFNEFIRHNSLDEKIKALEKDSSIKKLAELQGLIAQAYIPSGLDTAIGNALKKIKNSYGEGCSLAVRSSAEEEDSESSFAGQFETVLNVKAEKEEITNAYKKVIASLFSGRSVTYQEQREYRIGSIKMAVGCMVMVDAVSSGVIYTADPSGDKDTLIINAAWGLGSAVVEGQINADLYIVRKDLEPEIISIRPGSKSFMIISAEGGGTDTISSPDDIRDKECLSGDQIIELARLAITIESHFRRHQDIEWAIDRDGRIFILQSRPLIINKDTKKSAVSSDMLSDSLPVLIKNTGIAVQKGVAGGRVFILRHMDELDYLPKGAILVSRHDSSNFVKAMPFVSAIITDIGTPTSHMASICREFNVPALVNAVNATGILKHGQEVTVAIDEENVMVYAGIVPEVLRLAGSRSANMEDIYEFRKKKYILRYILPLNLIDPLLNDFTPESCKTIHDILRFIHEKSVTGLVENARYGGEMFKGHSAVKLDLPIPAGIIAIDIGGGLAAGDTHGKIRLEQITSIPLRAVIEGMMHPGAWHHDAVSLRVNDLISSMTRMTDISSDADSYIGCNVAVASREYVNLSLKFGYHFTMLDSYCSPNTRDNHIYFRFAGGATDIAKRSRRAQLVGIIMREYGFNLKMKGDLVIARLANIGQDEIKDILNKIGRLMAYTRQLDVMMHDDGDVDRYAKKFIEEKYEITHG